MSNETTHKALIGGLSTTGVVSAASYAARRPALPRRHLYWKATRILEGHPRWSEPRILNDLASLPWAVLTRH